MSLSNSGTSSNGWEYNVIRQAPLLNHNAAYTVLFRLYVPSSPAYWCAWCIGDSQAGASNWPPDRSQDQVRFKSDGHWLLRQYNGATIVDEVDAGAASGSTWYSVAIIRTDASHLKLRLWSAQGSGTTTSGGVVDISGRASTRIETLFSDGTDVMASGTKYTNYKSWNVALSDGELDAEVLTTVVSKSSGLYSVSPMSDTSTVAGNLTQTGSAADWYFAGSTIIAGANDPNTTYATAGGIPKTSKLTLLGVG